MSPSPAPPDGDLPMRLRRWRVAMRGNNLSERTINERVRVMLRLSEFAARDGEDLEHLSTDTIAAWLAECPPASRFPYRAIVSAWSKWLVLARVREDDPVLRLGTPKRPKYAPKPLEAPELASLLAAARDPRSRMLVLLAAGQGLRVHEIAKVRGDHVNLLAGTLHVVGKGGVAADLPLDSAVAELAPAFPARGWWFPRPGADEPVRPESISRAIGILMRAAGVRGTAHWLRHTFGTDLIRSGVDMRTTQELMRHATPASTAQYTRIDAAQKAAALARLAEARAGR